MACYRRVLEIDPENAVAHNNLGNVYFNLGQFAEAVACYRRAVELQPDSAAAHGNLGCILKDIGQPLEGLKSLRRALEISPEFTDGPQQPAFHRPFAGRSLASHPSGGGKDFGEIVARQAKPATSWNNPPILTDACGLGSSRATCVSTR